MNSTRDYMTSYDIGYNGGHARINPQVVPAAVTLASQCREGTDKFYFART